MNPIFENVKKNFGFGMMRLPMIADKVDTAQVCKMVDLFLEKGFNYFDTAHGYLDGQSEVAIRECLTSRYPRDRYILTNKLSPNFFESDADIRPLFQKQLEACGVEYFDYYLLHAMSEKRLAHYEKCRAFEIAGELKAEGKVKHIGMSFHDSAAVLDMILHKHPEIEVVQLQFNYVDFEDAKVQSRMCYEVCRKHGKPVIVMEPVKGGSLVNLPDAAQKIFDELHGGSNASYAIRFAAGFENIKMVLSGMSTLSQMEDNLSFMENFQPLSKAEEEAVDKVRAIYCNQRRISCTSCRYCTGVCRQNIPIPELFAALNDMYTVTKIPKIDLDWECLGCGQCEEICPQELKIRELLKVAKAELK